MTDSETTSRMADSLSPGYKFKLEVFEGPLDLLLYLVKRSEIDLYDIPMEAITRQYLEHIDAMQQLNIDVASEFIAMAAHLLMIKSRLLLPAEIQNGDDEDFEDPRLELVQMLLEYKQFKEAAENFSRLYTQQESVFPRGNDPTWEQETPENTVGAVNVFDLCEAFREALKKARSAKSGEIHADPHTVEQKVFEIRKLLETQAKVSFQQILSKDPEKSEIICLFLALLELTKLQEIWIRQEGRVFGELSLQRRLEREAWVVNSLSV